jgi:hypothetical protein
VTEAVCVSFQLTVQIEASNKADQTVALDLNSNTTFAELKALIIEAANQGRWRHHPLILDLNEMTVNGEKAVLETKVKHSDKIKFKVFTKKDYENTFNVVVERKDGKTTIYNKHK